MLALLGVVLAAQITLQESSPRLRDTLAAALATNEAKARQGSGTFDLIYQYDRMKKKAEANVRLKWANGEFEFEAKLDDPEAVFFSGRPAGPIREQKQPSVVLMCASRKLYCFVAAEKVVRVSDRIEAEMHNQVLNVSPSLSWFWCCGPVFGAGRPWIDLVDMKRPPGSTDIVSGKLDRQGDRLRFLRSDVKASFTIDFSLANDLNVVGFSYRGMGGGPGSENKEGVFQWRRLANGNPYLVDMSILRFVSNTEEKQSEYRLITREFSFEPPPKDYFTERAFFSRLPENVLVMDHSRDGNDRQYLINKKAAKSRVVDQSFLDAIKGGSLLNKKP